MTDIVKGTTAALLANLQRQFDSSKGKSLNTEEAMRAALLWLADNVSDEMLAAHAAADKGDNTADFRAGFAAAIRAAAGEEGK